MDRLACSLGVPPTKHETCMKYFNLFHSDFKWNILYKHLWHNLLTLQLKHFITSSIINISNETLYMYIFMTQFINVAIETFHNVLYHKYFKWNVLYIYLWHNSLTLQLKHFITSYIINISNETFYIYIYDTIH